MHGETYLIATVICAVLSLLALIFYAIHRIGPCSFRLSIAFTRLFSFSVEMESHSQDAEAGMNKRLLCDTN